MVFLSFSLNGNNLPTRKLENLADNSMSYNMRGSPIRLFNALIPTQIFANSLNYDGYFWHPVPCAYFQSRIPPLFCLKIPSPGLQIRQMPKNLLWTLTWVLSSHLEVFHLCYLIYYSQYGVVRGQWWSFGVSELHIFPGPSAVACTGQQKRPCSPMFTKFAEYLHSSVMRNYSVDTVC